MADPCSPSRCEDPGSDVPLPPAKRLCTPASLSRSPSAPVLVSHPELPLSLGLSTTPPPPAVQQVTATLLADGSLHFNGVLYAPFCLSPPPSSHRLLAVLSPVRRLFQPFLTDDDAARLLRVGRTAALSLLPGFTFRSHVFLPETEGQLWRLKALYGAYDLRVTRLCLPAGFEVRHFTDRSPFPSSLTALLFAPVTSSSYSFERRCPTYNVFDDAGDSAVGCAVDCPWTRLRRRLRTDGKEDDEAEYRAVMQRPLRPVQALTSRHGFVGNVFSCGQLPPGLLPHGLRRLHIAVSLDVPLLVKSLPSTIEVLQVDGYIAHEALSIGVLPKSLRHLVMEQWNYDLHPGFLPPSLERLSLAAFNQPLDFDVLPASLKALQLFSFTHPLLPGVLPAGLTHLSMSNFHDQIDEGVLPPSLVSLDLGPRSQNSLISPSVLPHSLRVLSLYTHGEYPLWPGPLPTGLAVLHWTHEGPPITPLPGQLPDSLLVMDLGRCELHSIAEDALPASVTHLLLPRQFEPAVELMQMAGPRRRVVWLQSE